jgi:hypothetical protein
LLRLPLGFGAPELGREARDCRIRPALPRSSIRGLHPLDLLEQLLVNAPVFFRGKLHD